MEFMLGCDPEVFVADNSGPVPAVGMVPGSKTEPHPVPFGMVQVDGLALEFGIAPATNPLEFSDNIVRVRKQLEGMVPKGCKLQWTASAEFDRDKLRKLPAEALELGCEPDYNAYTEDVNPRPVAPFNIRSAGGHVHIGWTQGQDPLDYAHFKSCCRLAIELDYQLGVPSMFADPDTRRRSIYGQAGAFRPKPYGMEYRTLSNFWVKDRRYHEWVWDSVDRAIYKLLKQSDTENMTAGYARSAINGNDMRTARTVFNSYAPVPDRFKDLFDRDLVKGKVLW